MAAVAFLFHNRSMDMIPLSEFHSFIKPRAMQMNTNGNVQYQPQDGPEIDRDRLIRTGPVLTRVMPKFNSWIKQLREDVHHVQVTPDGVNGNCCIVTWSEEVLNVLDINLHPRNVKLPSVFDFAVNLQKMFQTSYDYLPSETLHHAMQGIGIEATGDACSAKDTALNLGNLCAYMLEHGDWIDGPRHV